MYVVRHISQLIEKKHAADDNPRWGIYRMMNSVLLLLWTWWICTLWWKHTHKHKNAKAPEHSFLPTRRFSYCCWNLNNRFFIANRIKNRNIFSGWNENEIKRKETQVKKKYTINSKKGKCTVTVTYFTNIITSYQIYQKNFTNSIMLM